MADVAMPHRPQRNGVAERAVRRALEGTPAVLWASGLPHRGCADVARFFCFMRIAKDSADKDLDPHQLRHKGEFKGRLVPHRGHGPVRIRGYMEVGAVENFDSRIVLRIFVGYRLYTGSRWVGD